MLFSSYMFQNKDAYGTREVFNILFCIEPLILIDFYNICIPPIYDLELKRTLFRIHYIKLWKLYNFTEVPNEKNQYESMFNP